MAEGGPGHGDSEWCDCLFSGTAAADRTRRALAHAAAEMEDHARGVRDLLDAVARGEAQVSRSELVQLVAAKRAFRRFGW